jgi:hypothetical protein
MGTNKQPHIQAIEQSVLISERELALRWACTTRTLQRWRAEAYGPHFLRLGGSIRYRLSDIVDYENRHRSPEGLR